MYVNLHTSFDDVVQRMFNALEPRTKVPIARYPYSNETLIILRDRLRVLIFDNDKNIVEDIIIANNSDNIGYTSPRVLAQSGITRIMYSFFNSRRPICTSSRKYFKIKVYDNDY